MLRQAGHWLIWGVWVALQALTPFMHAHASTVQPLPAHAEFLHLHVATPAGQGCAESDHGAVLTVAQGVTSRALPKMPPPPATAGLPGVGQTVSPVSGSLRQRACAAADLPAPPLHSRPPSLAPPIV